MREQDDAETIEQWLDAPETIEHSEIPPGSGYWLLIREVNKWFEVYMLITYAPVENQAKLIVRTPRIEDARESVKTQGEKHLAMLAKKNEGIPTANQLAFLFRNNIPISPVLTFGQASNIISKKIEQQKPEQVETKAPVAIEPAAPPTLAIERVKLGWQVRADLIKACKQLALNDNTHDYEVLETLLDEALAARRR